MIKKVVREYKDVICCDLCEEETGFTADQGYAEYKYHFCNNHKKEENILEKLLEEDWEYQAGILMEEFKQYYQEEKNQKEIEGNLKDD